jgi:hypothetical protein
MHGNKRETCGKTSQKRSSQDAENTAKSTVPDSTTVRMRRGVVCIGRREISRPVSPTGENRLVFLANVCLYALRKCSEQTVRVLGIEGAVLFCRLLKNAISSVTIRRIVE